MSSKQTQGLAARRARRDRSRARSRSAPPPRSRANAPPTSAPGRHRPEDGRDRPKDVTDVVITSTDLSKEKVALKDRLFRARRLDIKPGGIVPWHSHGNRPAMIYVVKGTIIEYASTCAVPIVHKAGDISPGAHRHVALVEEHRHRGRSS